MEAEAKAATDASDAGDASALALDKVSLLQESVDKMALSMFNALRLLPASAQGEAEAKREAADAVSSDVISEPLRSIAASKRLAVLTLGYGQIRALASDVLQMVKETDALIDDLPGLDKTERCSLCGSWRRFSARNDAIRLATIAL